jgi:hypothetical protein
MSVLEAAYATVHNNEAEKTALIAEKMGLSKQVLLNKLNINNATHHLTLAEAVKLMQATHDLRILHALAAEFGGVYVPRVDALEENADRLISDISQMSMKFGALIQEVAKDIADGEISANELGYIEEDAMSLRNALEALLAHVRGIHDKRKPLSDASSRPAGIQR